jgi:hypothetical protein
MIVQITEGMTPVQFRNALNANFAVMYLSFTTVTSLTTPNLQTVLNSNFSKSNNYVGVSGKEYAGIINGNLLAFGLSMPTGLSTTWVDDYANMTFIDNSAGLSQHEIWEQKGSAAYTLVTTLATGITNYKNYTQQNASMNFAVRAKQGSVYSIYSSIVNLVTPWVLRCNQSTLARLSFYQFGIFTAGKVVNVDWDDGTSTDVDGSDPYGVNAVYHDWTVQKNPYFIKLTGDVNYINQFQLYEKAAILAGTDITKWNLPNVSFFCHLWSNGFIGDITKWDIEGNILPVQVGLHLASNYLTGDLSGWNLSNKTEWWDLHLDDNSFSGDLSTWRFGPKFAHITLGQNLFTGDISGWVFPSAPTYGDLIVEVNCVGFTGNLAGWNNLSDKPYAIEGQGAPFTGDLSGWTLSDPSSPWQASSILFWGSHFTKLPRGNFRNLSVFNFWKNSCNAAELDSFLAYVDAYFTGGVIPLWNCVYTLNGTGMGIPSAVGLASITSIIGKYTAAGKTCSILVNS